LTAFRSLRVDLYIHSISPVLTGKPQYLVLTKCWNSYI
jgi:hypothetical protein